MVRKAQLRQPRVAELLASTLRERILAGTYAAGDLLPKQDALLDEFEVSMPSLREALLILETEGLIKVRRGNVGGALVQVPGDPEAAYTIALVLQTRSVGLDDVSEAVRHFEPRAAAACATRPEAVLPLLRDNVAACEAALDDPESFVALARRFHELLVEHCGNETMRLVLGALETLWSAQTHQLTERTLELGDFAMREARQASLAEHAELVERIAAGDADGAEQVARAHLAHPERGAAFGRGLTVDADALRAGGR